MPLNKQKAESGNTIVICFRMGKPACHYVLSRCSFRLKSGFQCIAVSISACPQERLWRHDKTDAARIKLMVENSNIIVTAWDDKKMVGFVRCTTDYTFNGQINNVLVDKKYKRQDIGNKLINKILESNDKVTYILRADQIQGNTSPSFEK